MNKPPARKRCCPLRRAAAVFAPIVWIAALFTDPIGISTLVLIVVVAITTIFAAPIYLQLHNPSHGHE